MADDLDHLDDLPKRDTNHATEEKAEATLQARLTASGRFILQRADRKDYGTDCEIEVVDQEQATNVRVHVQLKGTERPLNADGSLSIEVSRTNLNYLLMRPHSFYVAYHIPTSSLRICLAETVLHQYEHAGKNWAHQQSLTVNFTDELTIARLDRLAALVRSTARAARDRRIEQTRTHPVNVAGLLRRGVADIHVPDDPAAARHLLANLYNHAAAAAEAGTANQAIVAAVLQVNELAGQQAAPLHRPAPGRMERRHVQRQARAGPPTCRPTPSPSGIASPPSSSPPACWPPSIAPHSPPTARPIPAGPRPSAHWPRWDGATSSPAA